MEPGVTAARAAVFGHFGINGTALALWVAHVPDIKRDLDLSPLQLGAALPAVAGGAPAAMQVAGRLIDRVGSAAVTRVSGVLLPLTPVGPAFAPSLPVAAVVLASAASAIGGGLLPKTAADHGVGDPVGAGRPGRDQPHALPLGLPPARRGTVPAASRGRPRRQRRAVSNRFPTKGCTR
jgi:MFS family permease